MAERVRKPIAFLVADFPWHSAPFFRIFDLFQSQFLSYGMAHQRGVLWNANRLLWWSCSSRFPWRWSAGASRPVPIPSKLRRGSTGGPSWSFGETPCNGIISHILSQGMNIPMAIPRRLLLGNVFSAMRFFFGLLICCLGTNFQMKIFGSPTNIALKTRVIGRIREAPISKFDSMLSTGFRGNWASKFIRKHPAHWVK